jgi:PAS domain S-box-containing protein
MHPDDLERIMEELNQAVTEKRTYNIRYRVRHKNGKYFWVADIGVCLFDADGKLEYIQGFWYDISDRVLTEQALKTSEEKYRYLVENEPVAVTRLRLSNKKYETVNKEFTRQSGYALDEFNSLSDQELIEMIYTDDRYMIFKFFKEWQEEGYKGLKQIEYRIINKDKKIVWLRTLLYSEFSENGEVEFLNQICIDITERKNTERALKTSEEKYKTFIEQASDGIFRIGMDKPFKVGESFENFLDHFYKYSLLSECNISLARMYGYENKSDITGMRIDVFHGGTNIPENINALRELYDNNFRIENVETLEVDKDNNKKYFTNNSFGVIENGYLTEFWGTQIDISKSKKIEQDLLESKQKAEEVSRAKTSFLANVSHEIRTPMNGIMGMIQLLELTNVDKEQREYINMLHYSSNILLNLINDMLDFSKIDSGREVLYCDEFDVRDLMNNIFNVFKIEALNKKLEYTLDFDGKTNYSAEGDIQKINQILANLISNAIKFTDSGFVRVSVEDKIISKEKLSLRITVTDSGIGIPKDKFDLLFERFTQLDSSINKSYKGTGLGLSIVKKLTDLIGGNITLESEEGKGSLFTCEIPLKILSKMENSDKPSKNILIVEDDLINQKLFCSLLSNKDYKLEVVDDGSKAFELFEKKKFDLIIMDIQLFGIDGIKTTKLIRLKEKKTGGRIPIIGITAYGDEYGKDECLKIGMDDYLTKPFDRDNFYEIIDKFLKQPVLNN